MHPVAFKKAMLEAFLAGASHMYCGCYQMANRQQAREWFENEYGVIEAEDCDCCEEIDENGDT
jgi:hypothetical protein